MLIPRLAACLFYLSLAACAGGGPEDGAAGGTGAVAPEMAGRLPDKLLVFERQGMAVLPTIPPSVAVRYIHAPTSGVASVILRRGREPLPDGIDSAPVREEVAGLTLTLIGALGNAPVIRLPDHILTRKGEAAPMLLCGNVLAPLSPEIMRRNLICVGGLAGQLVIIHVSGLQPRDKAMLAQLLFSAVAVQAMDSLRPAPSAPGVDAPVEAAPSGNLGPVFHL